MKITLIHGQNHQGSTYHVAHRLAEQLEGDVTEFFLPKDFEASCRGCLTCLNKGREFCPQAEKLSKIFSAMLSSDVLIVGSPTYCMEMSGQLKSFFDHLFTAWLSHRPEAAMFSKTAVVVSTAAGAGMTNVTKSLARQMFYLGVAKVYRLPLRVAANSWAQVKNKNNIVKKTAALAKRINDKQKKAKPGLKLRLMFMIMRMMQKGNDWSPLDREHWEKQGWLAKQRPF